MAGQVLPDGKMSPKLAELIEKAKRHRITPAERRAQQVSWIMSGMMRGSTMTREEVERMLDEMDGSVSAG